MSLKLLRDVPFGAVLCLVGVNYINSANAQQTDQQTGQQTIVTKTPDHRLVQGFTSTVKP